MWSLLKLSCIGNSKSGQNDLSSHDHYVASAAKAPRSIFWPLLAVVLLTPLPFASVTTWAWAPFASITASILAAWAVSLALGKAELSITPSQVAPSALLFAFVIAWCVLQMAPFTPPSWHHPVWRQAVEALGTDIAGSITVDPHATATALARLLWYATVFWLALQLCRNPDVARRALRALAFAAFIYATYGLVIEFSGARMVLWIEKFAYVENVTSTFINRNSYATYAGIGLLCLTALMVHKLAQAYSEGGTVGTQIAAGIVLLFEQIPHVILAWAVVITALLLTGSRAGVVSSLVGLFAFLGALAFSHTHVRRLFIWALAATSAALIGFLLISGEVVGTRLVRTLGGTDLRSEIFEITIGGIGQFPLLGTGYGTYAKVFQIMRPEKFSAFGVVNQAHNTYLENALELGIPAAAFLTLSVFFLAFICLRGVRRRRNDVHYPALGLGVSVLVGLHALVDFSLQIPAVSVTYAFVMGIACAQSWGRRNAGKGVPQ